MLMQPGKLQIRIHGPDSLPALVYLPGLHGDWTLIGSLRRAVAGRVRFVEMTYPRTLQWSLDEYAAAIESALAEHGITRGWLLGESFGSQVLWALAARNAPAFRIEGLILAGGFVKHPLRRMVQLAEMLAGALPGALFVRLVFAYARIARFRYRHSPEVLAALDEFLARRTPGDRRAAQHRLRLVAENDPRPVARQTKLPLFALSGILDPIVPWFLVRRWLRAYCPALRDYRVLRRADHNVLSTAPGPAADQILRWMRQRETPVTVAPA